MLCYSGGPAGSLRPWCAPLASHGGGVRSVAVSANGRLALSASDDGTVKVWDLTSGQELRTLAGHGNG